jgi:endonuclease-3
MGRKKVRKKEMAKKPALRAGKSGLSVIEICRRLQRCYGRIELGERLPPLDELIATILSQNTSDHNSDAAFQELRQRFLDWDSVRLAPTSEVIEAIRAGGLAQKKAPRIQAILEQLFHQRGELSLDFLCDLPVAEALTYLRGFPGVGPKTAACVLLFACSLPVLPVDTHVYRVSSRLGLLAKGVTAEKAHEVLGKIVPPKKVLDFHLLLIRHGRQTCKARQPHCGDCVLLKDCPEGPRQYRGPGLSVRSGAYAAGGRLNLFGQKGE